MPIPSWVISTETSTSFTDLASDEMKQVLYESMLLFEVNPTTEPPFELSETEGFDEQGNPIIEQHNLPLVPRKGTCRYPRYRFFLFCRFSNNDESSFTTGNAHLASLIKSEREPSIVGMSIIGSLGGIGHKRSSDWIQVIFNTNPKYVARWNDADYFLALLVRVTSSVLEDFYQRVLPPEVRTALYQKIEKAMQNLI